MIRKCLCLKLHHVSKGSSKKNKKKPFQCITQSKVFFLKKIFSSGGNSENIINISFYNCKILQNIKK